MQISPLASYKLKLFLKFLLLLIRAQWNYFYLLTPIKCFNHDPPYWASTSNVLVSMANLFKLKGLWYLPLSRGCWPLLNRYIRSFPPSLLAFAMHPGWDFLPTNCSSLNCNQNNSYSLIGKYGEIPVTPEENVSVYYLPTRLENPLKGPDPQARLPIHNARDLFLLHLAIVLVYLVEVKF